MKDTVSQKSFGMGLGGNTLPSDVTGNLGPDMKTFPLSFWNRLGVASTQYFVVICCAEGRC